uniref:Uncharacterized protein n=1 Tax=Anguilla anguilla TaxID=7936 RepID=A0A0E9S8I5_ANGAN
MKTTILERQHKTLHNHPVLFKGNVFMPLKGSIK